MPKKNTDRAGRAEDITPAEWVEVFELVEQGVRYLRTMVFILKCWFGITVIAFAIGVLGFVPAILKALK